MTTPWGGSPAFGEDSEVAATPVTEVIEVTEIDDVVIEVVEGIDGDHVHVTEIDITEIETSDGEITDIAIAEVELVGSDAQAFAASVADHDRAPSQGSLPLDVTTGDPRVDAAVASLRGLDQLPVTEHAEVFTQVHRDLQDALLSLDQG